MFRKGLSDPQGKPTACRQSAEGIVGLGNRNGALKRMANCEPARQAKAPEPETLDLNAATHRAMTGDEGPNGADPEWGR